MAIIGRARRVSDPPGIARLSRLPLRPWPPGGRYHFIRISLDLATGRRIRPPDGEASGRMPSRWFG